MTAASAVRIRELLEEIDRSIEDVDYRAANVRVGYVYVISNVGTFGEDVVEVGLTRRLDPLDRLRELGDASVPFRYGEVKEHLLELAGGLLEFTDVPRRSSTTSRGTWRRPTVPRNTEVAVSAPT